MKGSRKIAPEKNCPHNPKPNPDPDRVAIFLWGNFPDNIMKTLNKFLKNHFFRSKLVLY